MRVFMTIVLVLVAVVVMYLIVQATVRFKTRKLYREIAEKQRRIDELEQEVEDLRASEPEKMQLLRKENAQYDKLVDDILGALTPSSLLELSTPQEKIANLIHVHRPQRTF